MKNEQTFIVITSVCILFSKILETALQTELNQTISLTHLPKFFLLHSSAFVALFCPEGVFSSRLCLMSGSFNSHGAISQSGFSLWKRPTDHLDPNNAEEGTGANSKSESRTSVTF